MTLELRNRGTKIEEEDFCHWTEKDVEFKKFVGSNAELKKFYSWNKAILVQIEVDGTQFCGCLFEDNNSFAPVRFGPPGRPPLPRIAPSRPKPKKTPKAYSRENCPRVYIDGRNTVEQRLRSRTDKHRFYNRWDALSWSGEESPRRPAKKGVRRKKTSRCNKRTTHPDWRQSGRLRHRNSKTDKFRRSSRKSNKSNGASRSSIPSASGSNETRLLIDLTASPSKFGEIQPLTDGISDHSAHHSMVNPENKDSDVSRSPNKENEDLSRKQKKRRRRKKRVSSKECSDLSDRFERMTIRTQLKEI